MSEQLEALIAQLEERTKEIESIMLLIVPYLEEYRDCGPRGEGWQSDQLLELIERIKDLGDERSE